MNAHEQCLSKEVLKNELSNDDSNFISGAADDRLLVNPDFVQNMDQSDGSKAFDFEGDGTEGFD